MWFWFFQTGRDFIRVNDLKWRVLACGKFFWNVQPITLTLSIPHDITPTATTDDLSHSIDYGKLSKSTRTALDSSSFESLELLSLKVFDIISTRRTGIRSTATFQNGKYKIYSGADGLSNNWLDFRGLTRKLYESIAETSFETLEALTSFGALTALTFLRTCNIAYQSNPILNIAIAKPSALVFAESSEVEIRRTYDDYPEVTTVPVTSSLNYQGLHLKHTAAVALGSNMGDRFHNIELALRLLIFPSTASLSVVDTSFMYETAPMYVTDQPSFINCACMIETNLQPLTILLLLKKIENIIGRVPSIRNGPRAIDLDLIFYDDVTFDSRPEPTRDTLDNLEGELVIPHPRLAEREFVLRPLNDMIPDFVHPALRKKVSTLLANVPIDENVPQMQKVIIFPQYPIPSDHKTVYPGIVVPPTLLHWTYPIDLSSSQRSRIGRETHIMATLNATPDSFSDGSRHDTIETGLAYAKKSVIDGAAIVDIGGYSTRPRADFVSIEEEMRRVVPMIEAIRQTCTATSDALISVDTFRWEVAEASINAGANCINDVYAFSGPEYPIEGDVNVRANEYMKELKRIAGKYSVPVVLMHSRGDAGKNKDYSAYEYAGKKISVVEGVRVELGQKVDHIVKGKGGLRRWMVIVDPGIGFSKTLEGNLELLREAALVTADVFIGEESNKRRNPLVGYPQLIGVSKKSFLGTILSSGEGGRMTTPAERVFATASAVTCAIQQGACIVRVHDVKEIYDTVRVADAIWN
ncbi:Dihydropteroate synthase-like protein [Cyathus striatus]|nr:Dihydropteroate synthase-like protein [Cyathus striatus]